MLSLVTQARKKLQVILILTGRLILLTLCQIITTLSSKTEIKTLRFKVTLKASVRTRSLKLNYDGT